MRLKSGTQGKLNIQKSSMQFTSLMEKRNKKITCSAIKDKKIDKILLQFMTKDKNSQ